MTTMNILQSEKTILYNIFDKFANYNDYVNSLNEFKRIPNIENGLLTR